MDVIPQTLKVSSKCRICKHWNVFTDPCEPGNSKILHVDGDRSTSCKEKSMSLCDNTFNNEWYRVQKNGFDLKMPNTCVDQDSCGTKYPIYLSGMIN